MNFEDKRKQLVEKLSKREILNNQEVINAMLTVPRHLFIPKDAKSSAYMDTPL